MKLRVGGVEVEAKLSEGHAADGSGRAVVVLQDGRALGALDAVVQGVELVSATGEELNALLEAGYVLTGAGLTERPLLPWRYWEPVAMEVLRESPHADLVSARDARWAVEWLTEDGKSSLWVGSGATAHEALADARAECYAMEVESGELVVHKLQRDRGWP
jgi:hypothetical protein